jgi:hypothetical protein
MKKINKFMCFAAIIAVAIFVACDKSENITKQDSKSLTANEQDAFNKLNYNISNYNQQFIGDRGTQQLSILLVDESNPNPNLPLDPVGNWKKIWKIAKADISGAGAGVGIGFALAGLWGGIFGGLAGGVVYSLAEPATPVTPVTPSTPDSPPVVWAYITTTNNQNVVFAGNGTFEMNPSPLADSIGYYHNLIIQRLVEKNPNILNEHINEIVDKVIIEIEALFPVEFENIDKAELKVKLKTMAAIDMPIIKSSDTPFADLVFVHPDLEQELLIIENYVSNVSSLNPDIQIEYSIGFLNIVRDSEISNMSKDILYFSAQVALSSSRLWTFQTDKKGNAI